MVLRASQFRLVAPARMRMQSVGSIQPLLRRNRRSAQATPPSITSSGLRFTNGTLSLRKQFNLPREGMGLQFRVDAYNAFNQTNWSGLNGFSVNNVGSASFGQITQSFPARVLQFGAKFSF